MPKIIHASKVTRASELIAVPDWRQETGLRPGVVRGVFRRGELVPFRVGRCLYVNRAEADAWIAGRRRPSPKPQPEAA